MKISHQVPYIKAPHTAFVLRINFFTSVSRAIHITADRSFRHSYVGCVRKLFSFPFNNNIFIRTERLFGNTDRIVVFSLEFEISGVGVQRIRLLTMVQTVQRQLRISLQMKKIITNAPSAPQFAQTQHINNSRKGALLPFRIPFSYW